MKARSILFILFAFMVCYKLFVILNARSFNLRDDTALYWTESAFQYRTARHVATTGSLAALMTEAQYPEGIDMKNRLTTVMEVACGYGYRLFVPKSVPFHLYAVIFVSVWSSLAVFPLYLTIKLLCKNEPTALCGAALYAVTPAVYTTAIAPGFELQDFALPLIFFHVYFFARALSTQKSAYTYAFASGAFLFAALASWYLAQFYYTVIVVFAILCFLFAKGFDMRPFYVLVLFTTGAGLTIPALRSTGFVLSLPMLFAYGTVLASVLPVRRSAHKRLVLSCFLAAAVVLNYYISSEIIPEYQLVYGLLLDKVRYLGARPAYPGELTWETLVMWVSPFTSPSPGIMATSLGTVLVCGTVGTVVGMYRIVKRKAAFIEMLFFYCVCVFASLYTLVVRLDVFLVWFLCVVSASIALWRKRIFFFIVSLCVIGNAVLLLTNPGVAVGPDRTHLSGVVAHIRMQTPRRAPVLTSFAYSPTVLAYTERPVLLHPKFEVEYIAAKTREYEHRLFQSENAFYAFCRSFHASYVLYQTDILLSRNPTSTRYRTHNMTLSRESVAYKFHFRPQELQHFDLVYTNPHYRLYRVCAFGEQPAHRRSLYSRVYDEEFFNLEDFGIQ
jgi:hypothetical protein